MDKKLKEYKIINSKNTALIDDLIKSTNLLINDNLKGQLFELWKIRNPGNILSKELGNKFIQDYTDGRELKCCGNWIIYPWRKLAVHILEDELFQEIRTARNKLLINTSEQRAFSNYKIAIVGLSVGNSIAITIRMQGGSKSIKLSDNDILEISNMNRIRAGVPYYGMEKTEIVRRQILEIDPYSDIKLFSEGINEKNISEFIKGVDLIFDEVDDLKIKILLRIEAKRKKLPMMMITDNEDGVLVDYYPYHKKPKTPFFYGIKDELVIKLFDTDKISKQAIVDFSSKIVGENNISQRMKLSLKNVGTELYSWPQLGTAALTSGVVGCYFARMLSVKTPPSFTRGLFRINDIAPCY